MQEGISLNIFGGALWTKSVLRKLNWSRGKITPVYQDDYIKALCGSKLALCFLSKINRDTYTRRCFEIPATGSVLVCERTDDLTRLFKEDDEAVFFSSPQELVKKVKALLKDESRRLKIAKAGLARVQADDHSVVGRARHVAQIIRQNLETRL